jgi:aryl-alcohol dehydrogenase-like predicted oxidoreductase
LTLFERFNRDANPQAGWAAERYVALAREHDLSPAQMALAWVTSRPLVTSTTSLAQIEENLQSLSLILTPEVIDGIQEIHRRQPNHSP